MVALLFSAGDQPYYVRLNPARNFVHYLSNKPLDAITAVLRERDGVAVNIESIQAQLQSGKYLILFDGISEIATDQSAGMQEILRFARNADYKNCRFFVATRPELSIDIDIPIFYLDSLPAEFIKILLIKYSQEKNRPRIRHQLRRFGERPLEPLLLYMILAQSKDAVLSDTRSRLFENYFRKLLRVDNDTTWNGWRTILEEFARWSFVESGSRGIGIIHESLIDRMKDESYISTTSHAINLLTRVQEYYDLHVRSEFDILTKLKSVGIMAEARRWRFAQDPFEEYFAASYIVSTLERDKPIPDLSTWAISEAQVQSFCDVFEFISEIASVDIINRLNNSDIPVAWKNILYDSNHQDGGCNSVN